MDIVNPEPIGESPGSGPDLHAGLRITADEAERGAKVTFLLPDGRENEVQVPPGVREGTVLRIPGKGSQEKGDLLLHIQIIRSRE
jgi:curved DNA-binding protein